MTSQQQKKSESGRGPKRSLMMAFLPPDPTDEELQRFADFLNGELEEGQPNPPSQNSTPTD